MEASRAEVCAAAIADAFAEDGEIFASPMGLLPTLGVRLAKLTSNPDLLISDGESLFLGGVPPLGEGADVVEGWIPFRRVFDVVAWGKRHVMMGATQVDRHGNQNISAIGDFEQAEATAARLPRGSGQHGQQPDVVLDPEALPAHVRRAGRRGLRGRPRSARRRRAPPPRGSTTSTGS